MHLPRSIQFGLCHFLLVMPVGCVTDGAHNWLSQKSTSPSEQIVALDFGTTADSVTKNVDRTAAKVESGKSAELSEAELVPVAYSDEPTAVDEWWNQPTESISAMADVPGDVPVAAAGGFTLESLEQLALENNPAIREASAAVYKATGIRTQVGLKPNPTVGYIGSQLADAGTDQQGVFINQDIVLGNKLALNQGVLDQDVQALMWEVEAQRYRVLTDIRRRFYDALAAQRRLELASSFQEVTRKGVRIAEDRVRALEGARPDVLQAEIQFSEVDLITQRAQIDFDAAWRELASVAGVPYMQAPLLVGTLEGAEVTRELETAYSELMGRSPELQAAYTRVQRARVNLARQQAQPIPNLQSQFAFGYDNGTGEEFLNVQVGMPLPIHNRNQGNICAAQAEYNRATQEVRRLELSLRARLTRAMRTYDVAYVTVDRYENQILPKADESLQLSEEAHAAGEFDFLRVLVSRRTYFDANLNYVQALADLAKADALIEGLQLSGGLSDTVDFMGEPGGEGLRGQSLSGQ